jgi:hypothetical protein
MYGYRNIYIPYHIDLSVGVVIFVCQQRQCIAITVLCSDTEMAA